MIPDELKQAIAKWWKASGLSEDTVLLELGRVVNDDVAVMRPCAGFPMLAFQDRGAARPPAPRPRPVRFSDHDAEAIRRLGHDPRLIARANEIRDLADYRRIRREVEGAAR